MVITEIVKIKWNPKTKKWYENKGYIYTKTNNEFIAKVKDLTHGCIAYVEVKCDCENCKNPYLTPMTYQKYLQGIHEDGRYYCRKCSMRLFSGEKIHHTRLVNGKSFKIWCVEENKEDVLNRFDNELNKFTTEDICCYTHDKYYFKCPRGIHKSELKQISNFTSGEEGVINCRQCNSFAQFLIDSYGEYALDLYWDYEKNINKQGNKINPWQVAKNTNKKVWIKCQEKDYHESYLLNYANFVKGDRCPYCSSNKVHPLDSVGKLLEDENLLEIWSEKNKKSPYEYAPKSNKKVWWKCVEGKHKDYFRSINNSNKYSFRCPECMQEKDESFLQRKVRLYLESLDYTILHEHNCTIIPKNPKTNHLLPFDNEIIINNKKLIIEVNGIQHYKICSWHKSSAKIYNVKAEYELHMIQVRDRYKKFISYTQDYNYIAIPYWTDDKEGTWKQLIDNKINELNNIIV